ncbi:MAG: riboflavin synthase, partial [Alphaproteobacteria bacterium]
MFTGIISDVGRIGEIRRAGSGEDRRLIIETGYDTATIAIGASIACAGPCLTVVETGEGWFAVDVSAETLDCTTIGDWQVGGRINLERSLKLGDEMGGHLVSGHVDGVGELMSRHEDGGSEYMTFSAPADLMRFIAVKGSIAVDGISLTVNAVGRRDFTVNTLPHTLEATTLGDLSPGAAINLEIDLLARYVAR